MINNDGELTTDAIENIAAANNIEPAEARERIAHVMAAMEREACVESAKAAETSEALAREAIQAARVEKPALPLSERIALAPDHGSQVPHERLGLAPRLETHDREMTRAALAAAHARL